MPKVIIVAGPNGSGKTTTAPALLKEIFEVEEFVNADMIAQGLCVLQPERVAIQAGRVMLKRLQHLSQTGVDFAFETTLASRSFAPWIQTLVKQNYELHLIFLWLRTVDMAKSRVDARVKMGGHSIPQTIIERRYLAGLKNFFQLYAPLALSWRFYDNSNLHPQIIASKIREKTEIFDPNSWHTILEIAHVK